MSGKSLFAFSTLLFFAKVNAQMLSKADRTEQQVHILIAITGICQKHSTEKATWVCQLFFVNPLEDSKQAQNGFTSNLSSC